MLENEPIIKLENDRYYILASSSYADDRTRVLNNGDTFAIFDRWGDIKQLGTRVQGLYHEGTRFISDLQFYINDQRPVLLSSIVKDENEILSIDLSNPRLKADDDSFIEKGVLHIMRSKFLLDSVCFERLSIHNYGLCDYAVECKFWFAGDFKDIFQVRGMHRDKKGELLTPEVTRDGDLKIEYHGIDNKFRVTTIRFSEPMTWRQDNSASHKFMIHAGQRIEIDYSIQCDVGTAAALTPMYVDALERILENLSAKKAEISDIETNNEQFTHWINRSKKDLVSLLARTDYGFYPYAGVPWYNTTFGRDGIITAMEALWVAPSIARGVLLFLAAKQATELDPFRDAEPGKILHEARGGEMAELNEIPFREYYGTIDATPLFIALAGQYFRRTDDRETILKIWPNIERAIQWIEHYGDIDRDRFVEYKCGMDSGLQNQGWKDSHDAISHADGTLASAPIALCEVQGYVYDAYRQASYLARYFNKTSEAIDWKQKAVALKRKFNKEFWDEESKIFALALDGNKEQCRVKTSNAGQCLFTGIVEKRRVEKMIDTLMQPDLFCGWGMRTLSSGAVRYNPMSYHNGSVWPHDTALVAAGMSRYGYVGPAMKLMEGLFSASLFLDLQRLPELFCGFAFREGEAPTSYPVACMPQAWSVSAVYLMLQACLQMVIDAPRKTLSFRKPALPGYLKKVSVRKLVVPSGTFELEFQRHEWDVGIHIISKPKDWKVIVKR